METTIEFFGEPRTVFLRWDVIDGEFVIRACTTLSGFDFSPEISDEQIYRLSRRVKRAVALMRFESETWSALAIARCDRVLEAA